MTAQSGTTDQQAATPADREAFKAAMRAIPCPDHWTFEDDGTGGFHNDATEWAWIAWNARAPSPEPATTPTPEAMFDALGEPRTRHVRVTFEGASLIDTPSGADSFMAEVDPDSRVFYVLTNVYLSEREFEDLPEFDGF